MTTPRKRAKRAKASPRLSRSELAAALTDLCGRLEKQVWIAEAIVKTVAPTDDTVMRAWPIRKVIELAADAHLSALRQATQFARMISDKVA